MGYCTVNPTTTLIGVCLHVSSFYTSGILVTVDFEFASVSVPFATPTNQIHCCTFISCRHITFLRLKTVIFRTSYLHPCTVLDLLLVSINHARSKRNDSDLTPVVFNLAMSPNLSTYGSFAEPRSTVDDEDQTLVRSAHHENEIQAGRATPRLIVTFLAIVASVAFVAKGDFAGEFAGDEGVHLTKRFSFAVRSPYLMYFTI